MKWLFIYGFIEALRLAPDGNIYTGYAALNNHKIEIKVRGVDRLVVTPVLLSELTFDVEVFIGNVTHYFKDVKDDVRIAYH